MRLWEAFLLQMNDFETLLEQELRRMLDPVVATRPPTRRGPLDRPEPVLTVQPAPIELAPEPVPVTVSVSASRLLS